MRFQKILAPTDLSPESERAFAEVAELARRLGAGVVLLHVVENVGAAALGTPLTAPVLLPGTEEELARARALLLERKRRAFEGLEVELEVLVAPSVPRAIVDAAHAKGCDLIALSTHGRTGFRRLIVGSVAEAVLRASRVPVLAFPRQD